MRKNKEVFKTAQASSLEEKKSNLPLPGIIFLFSNSKLLLLGEKKKKSFLEKINLRQDLDYQYQKEADRDTRQDEEEGEDLENQ